MSGGISVRAQYCGVLACSNVKVSYQLFNRLVRVVLYLGGNGGFGRGRGKLCPLCRVWVRRRGGEGSVEQL